MRTDEAGNITEVEVNYNNTPVKLPEGAKVIAGYNYVEQVSKFLGKPELAQMSTEKLEIFRMTLISKKPLLPDVCELSTFTVPPMSEGIQNSNPIRVNQLDYHIEASPKGSYLYLISMQISEVEADKAALYRMINRLFDIDIEYLKSEYTQVS